MNSTLPNPDTYLNHLPPNDAREFEITRDVYLAILGASVWDVLVYIPDDVKIVSRGFGPVTFCFVFSRVFAITYALLSVLVQTRPIANCTAMSIATGIMCPFAMSCTSFLFLRRLHAVYHQQRTVRWVFSFIWFVGACLTTITLAIGISAAHIEGTGYCIIYQVHRYTVVSGFLPIVFDTLVFFAISYKLISDKVLDGAGKQRGSSVNENLTVEVSQVLLRGGQQYYMIVFWTAIATGVVLYTPSIPVMYRPMLTLASTSLAASMSCRVFRNLRKFASSSQSSEDQKIPELRFAHSLSNRSKVPRRASLSDIEA